MSRGRDYSFVLAILVRVFKTTLCNFKDGLAAVAREVRTGQRRREAGEVPSPGYRLGE